MCELASSSHMNRILPCRDRSSRGALAAGRVRAGRSCGVLGGQSAIDVRAGRRRHSIWVVLPGTARGARGRFHLSVCPEMGRNESRTSRMLGPMEGGRQEHARRKQLLVSGTVWWYPPDRGRSTRAFDRGFTPVDSWSESQTLIKLGPNPSDRGVRSSIQPCWYTAALLRSESPDTGNQPRGHDWRATSHVCESVRVTFASADGPFQSLKRLRCTTIGRNGCESLVTTGPEWSWTGSAHPLS
jgi:hypothetical protein